MHITTNNGIGTITYYPVDIVLKETGIAINGDVYKCALVENEPLVLDIVVEYDVYKQILACDKKNDKLGKVTTNISVDEYFRGLIKKYEGKKDDHKFPGDLFWFEDKVCKMYYTSENGTVYVSNMDIWEKFSKTMGTNYINTQDGMRTVFKKILGVEYTVDNVLPVMVPNIKTKKFSKHFYPAQLEHGEKEFVDMIKGLELKTNTEKYPGNMFWVKKGEIIIEHHVGVKTTQILHNGFWDRFEAIFYSGGHTDHLGPIVQKFFGKMVVKYLGITETSLPIPKSKKHFAQIDLIA